MPAVGDIATECPALLLLSEGQETDTGGERRAALHGRGDLTERQTKHFSTLNGSF